MTKFISDHRFNTTYSVVSGERKIEEKTITVVNLTPEFSDPEKRQMKLETEQKLYDIFCKYIHKSIE